MTAPVTRLDPRFSQPDAQPTSWEETARILAEAEIFQLGTVRRDGRPHATPLVAVWTGEALCFCCGEGEQKALNLAANPHVVLTTGSNRWTEGTEVVVEGEAAPVRDESTLRQLAELWTGKWDGRWQYEVGDGCFHHPGTTDRVLVFAVAPDKVLAIAEGRFGQTTHRFPRTRERAAGSSATGRAPGFVVTSIAEEMLEDGWAPLRRALDLTAFGLNAWTRPAEATLVTEHDEAHSGQHELYLLLSGAATFRVGEEEIELTAGQLVFINDPALRRTAVAREDGTTVLVVGSPPDAAYRPGGWDVIAVVLPHFRAGEYELARDILAETLERHPDEPTTAYNLACAEARLGERDRALEHLSRAVKRLPAFATMAAGDEDLASLADDPRFGALTSATATAGRGVAPSP